MSDSYYRKVTRDKFNDPLAVEVDGDHTVFLHAVEGQQETYMAFTPDAARKLARRILKAAKVAEGNE